MRRMVEVGRGCWEWPLGRRWATRVDELGNKRRRAAPSRSRLCLFFAARYHEREPA